MSSRSLHGLPSVAPTEGPDDPGPVLGVMSLAELCKIEVPDAEPLLGALVRRGQRVVIGAPTGEGKTTLVMHIVRAVVGGGRFLEWEGEPDAAHRVLVIDAEQTLPDIQRVADETGLLDCEAVDYVSTADGRTPEDGLRLNESEAERDALEMILAEGRYSLVVADPLYKLHTGDSNEERDAVDLMRLFDRWRSRYGFALLMPSHCRKRPDKVPFTINEIFGSGAWVRGAEVVLGLEMVTDGYSRLHFFKARSGGLPVRTHWGLSYRRGEGFYRVKDDAIGVDEAAEQVRNALIAAGATGLTIRQLMAATGRKRDALADTLARIGAVGAQVPGLGATKYWSLPGPEQGAQTAWEGEDG